MQGKAKVVVAYLDGRRLKGYVYDFSAVKDVFFLFPDDGHADHVQPSEHGTAIKMAELKAVFFVKEFAGDPKYNEVIPAEMHRHGRKVEVTFSDGEKRFGVTEAYNRQKPGFFLFPADPKSNNDHIFVVNKNVKDVKLL